MEKYKNIIIGILVLTLIGLYLFSGDNLIDSHGEELNRLRLENESLIKKNDSIRLLNLNLDKRVLILDGIIETKEDSLEIANKRIKELQDGKIKVNDFVDGLDIDGVDRALTEYLETRQN